MSTQTHELKTRPNLFQQTWDGDRPFEIRLDDRGYQRGDTVVLREFDERDSCTVCDGAHGGPACGKYSGRQIRARIGFVQSSTPPRGQQRGFVGNGYVVFSVVDIVSTDGRRSTGGAVPAPNPAAVREHLDALRRAPRPEVL